MEEKTYRNLKEFDHLNDITKHCLEYRDTMIEDNVLYAPKEQVPYEINFNELFIKLNKIFEGYTDNIFICGGAALGYYMLNNNDITVESNDIDLFISSREDKQITNENIRNIVDRLFLFDYILDIKESSGAISFNFEDGLKIQIIKRIYSSPSEIIHGFDIDISCILVTLTDNKIYITNRGLYALLKQVNTINFERLSPSYAHRLIKYYYRGISIYDPFLDYFRNNFVTDFRHYRELNGSLILYYKLLKKKKRESIY